MTQGQLLMKIAMLSGIGEKTYVPLDFHERAAVIKRISESDSSGLVNTLGNFQVDCATVDIKINTGSVALDSALNNDWLANINKQYRGYGIERGVKGLEKEYYKERWLGASFPILKIVDWEEINGFNLPTGLLFVDGGSVYARKQESKNEGVKLLNYDYCLGQGSDQEVINPKKDTHFIYKPYTRWYVRYPSPYYIAKGIYKNWLIIDKIKNKELDIVSQIIPYLMHVIKGAPELELAEENAVSYKPEHLEATYKKFESLIEKMATGQKLPINVTNWDEQIKHLIPDLEAMFKQTLFSNAEKAILAGFGFIDIIQGVGSNRKESIINPRAFIREIDSGMRGFKLVISDLLELIKEKNPGKVKLILKPWNIDMGVNTEFITDKLADQLKNMRDRGALSERTYTDIISRELTDYDKEMRLLNQEKESKETEIIVPKPTQVQDLLTLQQIKDAKKQGKIAPIIDNKKVDTTNKEGLTDDKKGPEAKDYKTSALKGEKENE